MFSGFGWLAIILILVFGGVMSTRGAGREFREVLLTFLMGVAGVVGILAIAWLIGFWSPTLGWIFALVVGLYLVDWMIWS